jgi:hypothetical protein
MPGARPIHLTANNNNNQTLIDVRSGYYSHILVSPEIANVFASQSYQTPSFGVV